MRIFKTLLLVAASFTFFLSCQKELQYDNSGASTGTLKKDLGGDCLPVVINGIYIKDSTLTAVNFVDVQVNVSFPGTFTIKSDSVNGFSFSKTGSVVLGLNTIRLYATGKPLVAGVNTFTVTYGTSTCSFDITVLGPPPPPAIFSLVGSPNACANATTAGVYTVGVPLTAANTLTIEVDVSATGAYTIAATTTNGFLYTGTGLFGLTGPQTVTLTGSGTPLTAGTTDISVVTPLSNCTHTVTVLGGGGGGPAVFTLDGAPGSCTVPVVTGTYAVGVATSVSNTVKLFVTVGTPGTYNITTNTVNGISFSGSGTLAAGSQTIILVATGTPIATGPFNTFKPNMASSCDFTITFIAAPPVPTGDYFPLTQNSWWSYDIIVNGIPEPDTLLQAANILRTQAGNSYRQVNQVVGNTLVDSLFYRKVGSDYHHYGLTDFYSAVFSFDVEQFADILFLKEAATGTTWTSPEYTGTIGSGTVPAKIQYVFKIENANTSITVNGVTYTNVMHVSHAVKISGSGAPYVNTENNDYYYAKGIGMVKVVFKDAQSGNAVIGEANIRNYKVF
jgi:hypothetical protein